MSATPIKRKWLITMPGDEGQPPANPNAKLAPVIPLGIARQRLRGAKASRDMCYHLDPPGGSTTS